MGVYDRRLKLLDILSLSGAELVTYGRLARELDVTEETIRTDIMALTCWHQIEIVRGCNGGVRLQREKNSRSKILTDDQAVFLISIRSRFNGEELRILDSIIHRLAAAL